jgi:predicted CXXCH cytochrome family protein
MRFRPVSTLPLLALLGLLPLLSAGCTDEKIVYREPFNPPPDAEAGFVGYFTTSDKSTTCGNCHVDHENKWVGTAHADAYATLANSEGAQEFCYGCHTVSENGNAVSGPAGWNAVQDTAYHDVQCESCHGPGVDHVETPDASAHPLARVRVLTADLATGNVDTDTATVAGSCAECHSGSHHPFVDEWRLSAHARVVYEEEEGIFISDESESCASCHEGRGALKAWGVTANYVERDTAAADAHLGITCAVCHDPHNGQNEGQLRFSISEPSFEANLCMKCHTRRYEPTGTRGPHAPQGPVLTGTAGYWPPGYDTTAQAATHGNPAANPRLCAGCHVNNFEVEDRLNPGETITSKGHLFLPIPCLDPTSGEPVADRSCEYTTTERYWGSCAASGCHADAAQVELAFSSQRSNIATLADLIWVDTDGDEVLFESDSNGVFIAFDPGDTGLLTQVPSPEINFNGDDDSVSVAEGALFNMQLIAEGRDDHGDGSKGVHNPFLSVDLLTASLNSLQDAYALSAPLSPEARALVDRINRRLLRTRAPHTISTR